MIVVVRIVLANCDNQARILNIRGYKYKECEPKKYVANHSLLSEATGRFGSSAALFTHSSLTAALARQADDSTLSFRGPGIDSRLSPIADVQIARNRVKRMAGNGQKRSLGHAIPATISRPLISKLHGLDPKKTLTQEALA